MGTHSSKEKNVLDDDLIDQNRKSAAKPEYFLDTVENHQGWQEICRCSHSQWLKEYSEKFGFRRHKFTCKSELHSVCAPGFCSESLSRNLHSFSSRFSTSKKNSTSKSKKLREHFEYNHIPAMIRSLQNYSVHGIVNGCSFSAIDQQNTIVLLTYSSVLDKSKFIIVDLKLNRFVCALGDDYQGLIDVKKVHSACSTDRTRILIRLPFSNGTFVLDFYQIVKKESKLFRRIISVDCNSYFQFSPNFWASQVAFYTSTSENAMVMNLYNVSLLSTNGSNRVPSQVHEIRSTGTGPTLSLINIHNWSTKKSEQISLDTNIFRLISLVYTPDSAYLILMFTDHLCHCNSSRAMSYLEFYHSKTLQLLHRFQNGMIHQPCPWHNCRNYLTPIFSQSSARMALASFKSMFHSDLQISVIVLPNEINLKSICRRCIIDYLSKFGGTIENFSKKLPYRLNEYLKYRPEYQ